MRKVNKKYCVIFSAFIIAIIVGLVLIFYSKESKQTDNNSTNVWVCKNPYRYRKGNSYNLENCYKKCDKFPKRPICVNTNDYNFKLDDLDCSVLERPIDC